MNQKIGVVYETTDYDQFKLVLGNRPLKTSGHAWNSLVKSLENRGQLEPALVTPNMEVVNGQHRLAACRKLGIPFKFSFGGTSVSAEDIADANSSKKWGAKEYITFFASQTDERAINYKLLQSLIDEFKLPPSVALAIVGSRSGKQFAKVRNGEFTLPPEKYNIIRTCMTQLKQLGFVEWRDQMKFPAQLYWTAITFCWRHPDVDMERLIKMMYANQYRIPSASKVPDFLRALSMFYNYRLGQKNKVYLETDFNQKKYSDWMEGTIWHL